MTDHTPLTRSEIQKLANQIKSGWLPPDDAVTKAWHGLFAVLDAPLRNPRATVRAARLVFELELVLGVGGKSEVGESSLINGLGTATQAD